MKSFISLFYILCYSNNSFSQEIQSASNWKIETEFPGGAVDDGSVFIIDDFIYAGSGIDQTFTVQKDWWSYSLMTKEWTAIHDLPGEARQYAASCSNDHYGFVFGGVSQNGAYLNSCFRFDSEINEWQLIGNAPWSPRAAMAIFQTAEAAYIVGGRSDSLKFDEVWKFSFESDEWTQRSSFPGGGHDEMIAFAFQGKGYVGHGRRNGGVNEAFWKYDIPNDLWEQIEQFPGEARSYSAAVSTKRGGIVVGGVDENSTILSEVNAFSTQDEQWTELGSLPDSVPLRGHGLLFRKNKLYTFGGLTNNFRRVSELFSLELFEFPETIENYDVSLFPNPCSDKCFIDLPQSFEEDLRLEAVKLNGGQYRQINISNGVTHYVLDTSAWTEGFYILHFSNQYQRFIRKLIVIKS
ncbi:MAG: kelch repeat-containing protein [Salibacteraceae bacterium]